MSDDIKIAVKNGDLEAIKTALHVCQMIATGGEMFIDGRRDYVSAASSLSSLRDRIEKAALDVSDV